MGEEHDTRQDHSDDDGKKGSIPTQPGPDRGDPEGQPNAEQEVEETNQDDLIIQQQKAQQRPRRQPPEHCPVQGDDAGNIEGQGQDQEQLARRPD